LAWAEFGLGGATLASETKKKKVARNFLKFGMEVYNLILSNSARDGVKIRKNEVYSLVLSFWPWRCTFCPWRGLILALVVHVLPLAWADFGLGGARFALGVGRIWPWWCNVGLGNEKKKSCSEFSQIWHGSL
jgi:hypothetical protein